MADTITIRPDEDTLAGARGLDAGRDARIYSSSDSLIEAARRRAAATIRVEAEKRVADETDRAEAI